MPFDPTTGKHKRRYSWHNDRCAGIPLEPSRIDDDLNHVCEMMDDIVAGKIIVNQVQGQAGVSDMQVRQLFGELSKDLARRAEIEPIVRRHVPTVANSPSHSDVQALITDAVRSLAVPDQREGPADSITRLDTRLARIEGAKPAATLTQEQVIAMVDQALSDQHKVFSAMLQQLFQSIVRMDTIARASTGDARSNAILEAEAKAAGQGVEDYVAAADDQWVAMRDAAMGVNY